MWGCRGKGTRISIHALREEGDRIEPMLLASPTLFLSTPSARRATVYLQNRCFCLGISIHALREEGDVVAVGAKLTDRQFLSTPSARRAT